MGFEWDDVKEAANAAKHDISFEEAIKVFADPAHIDEDSTRPEFGEVRRLAVGQVGPYLITVIFTYRQGTRRIISARRARRDERRRYRESSTSA